MWINCQINFQHQHSVLWEMRFWWCILKSCQKGSHVYFLLQVFWVIVLFCQIVLLFDINVVLMLPWWPDVTIVQSDVTIVVLWQLSTGSKHDNLLQLPHSGYSIWGTQNWLCMWGSFDFWSISNTEPQSSTSFTYMFARHRYFSLWCYSALFVLCKLYDTVLIST